MDDETEIENMVLGALEAAGSSLDADEVASQALLIPSQAGAVLRDLESRGLVKVVRPEASQPRFALDGDGIARAISER